MMYHKKIDLFYNGKYLASTLKSKTCKEAKASALVRFPNLDPKKLKANFDHKYRA